MSAFKRHLERVDVENLEEKFALTKPGELEAIYRSKPTKIWVVRIGSEIVAHCSVVDMGHPDGIRAGQVNVERPYRGSHWVSDLQRARFQYLDANGLTLLGPVTIGNDRSFHNCRKHGFRVMNVDLESQTIWMARLPGATDQRRHRVV